MKITEQLLHHLLSGDYAETPCAMRIVCTYQDRQGKTEEMREARCPPGMHVQYNGNNEHVVYGWHWEDSPGNEGFVWDLLGKGITPARARSEAWGKYDASALLAREIVQRVVAHFEHRA